MHNRQDITETNLKPALLEGETAGSHDHTHTGRVGMKSAACVSAFSSQTAFLETQTVTFVRHRSRLAVVREQKERARVEMLGEVLASRCRTAPCQHETMYHRPQEVKIQASGLKTKDRFPLEIQPFIPDPLDLM